VRAIVAPDVFEVTEDPAWIIEDDACDLLRETSRESRFTVSNGFLGVRCSRAIDWGARPSVSPGTFVAGLFDTVGTQGPASALVQAPGWLQIGIASSAAAVRSNDSPMLPHRLVLDMRRGMLLGESRHDDGVAPGIRIRAVHLVSLSTRATGLQLLEMSVAGAGVEIALTANVEQRPSGLVAEVLEQSTAVWRTKTSGMRLGMAVAASLELDGIRLAPATVDTFAWSWHWKSRTGAIAIFERHVAFSRGSDADVDVGGKAQNALDVVQKLGWRAVVTAHEAAWTQRWHESDIEVAGDAAAQEALRFGIYHLNSAADPTQDRVSIGARALTGEDYHGHVFWDTEIYLLPFYIMTWPEAARALLMYRFRTLDGARAKAVRLGWRGALYAWESADTGDETAPERVIGADRQVVEIFSGQEEQHISADVAYAIWQYWLATGDESFLLDAGAEVLLETGRFWASRAVLEADGRRHIRGVIGPDEYHEHVDDSAYTNVMARWNIRRALEVAALLKERWPARYADLTHRLALDESELEQWRDAAETMVTGFDPATGLFEEFEGYFGLEDIDLTAYAGRSVPMDVVLGRERTKKSQIVKQADVVALLALLPEEFPGAAAAANFHYYEPRCDHGSSLSRAMHALAAARLGLTPMAMRYMMGASAIDLRDTHAAIAGGVHIAAQGGIWLAAIFGFSGLSLRDDGVAIDPRLPPNWNGLKFRFRWRGRTVALAFDGVAQFVVASLEAGEPMHLFIRGEPRALRTGEAVRVTTAIAR
jgi:trehalose/maltose hydrolase-like predicted phosphorylase